MSTTSDSAPANPKRLILACDGGGIRGLITALLLQQLMNDYPKFLSQTYLFAGTSTGGIISLALAAGVQPKDLVTLYSTDGPTIFTKSACAQSDASADLAQVASITAAAAGESWWWKWIEFITDHLLDLICDWYTNTGLKTLIQSKLGSSASATLNSLAQGGEQFVLVNTLQLCDSNNSWTPLQLTNLTGIQGNDSGDTMVIDAAMSTSAAPMYFPPYNHPTYGYCADGGLFANNPGTIALTTLMESGVALEDIWMLSLGTGASQDCYPASIINQDAGLEALGPIFWLWPESQPSPAVAGAPYTPALPLMSAVFDGTSEIDTYQCQQLLGDRFRRANVTLTTPIALDDVSAAAITTMTDSTTSYIQTAGGEWADIESWIQKNF